MSDTMKSPNFEFLKEEDELLYDYAMRAERYVFDDPNTCLFKLRQFCEYMTQQVAIAFNIDIEYKKHVDLINELYYQGYYSPEVSQMAHSLRKEGNSAVHSHSFSEMRNALQQLKIAHRLASWYQQTINDRRFTSKAFVPPPNPKDAEEVLRSELEQLRQGLIEEQQKVKLVEQTVETQTRLRAEAEEAANSAYAELSTALELAEETETEKARKEKEFQAQIEKLKAQAAERTEAEKTTLIERAQAAAVEVEKDEQMTRILIDEQLRDHGWEVDTQFLRYNRGTRPQKKKNIAIAEWPTNSGPADYVLFCGLTPVAIIEAKREMKNISGDIEQAKRYSKTFKETEDLEFQGPWGEMKVPFLFATNGKPYHKEYLQMSGTWFLDCRQKTNHPRAFNGWYTPEGIQQLLKQDTEAADKQLSFEENNLPLRDYQKDAVEAVEKAIAQGQREIMLAMATGTGKTRTCIGLVYRLIKSRRFRRVLFLVDRTSLGEQSLNSFKDLKLDNQQTFNDIFYIKGLDDKEPETTTRLHITTVQSVMRRILYPSEGSLPLPVDMYDCIVVDECHRGYNLDKDMSELELEFRSEVDYISKYRRVIDHFDAVKIGLTATPALHTTDIFGMPVYHYSYRQAVVDGFLVDQEVPIVIETKRSASGISYEVGEEVITYNTKTKESDSFNAPDEINYDIEQFNKTVITKNYNKAICSELTKYINLNSPAKTLVFCATDDHADMVVQLLKETFSEITEVDDDAIVKITGRSDKPNTLIRLYKNEPMPKIAVTVDLLTTGIDVPTISNLVFLRCVKSRILYDQMIGRATRLCPDIDKQSFRIFDAVDLYKKMADHTDMKPIVTKTSVTFKQLASEMAQLEDELSLKLVRDQYCAKFHRIKKQLQESHSSEFEMTSGQSIDKFAATLQHADGPQISCMAETCKKVADLIERVTKNTKGRTLVISPHDDEVIKVSRGYGAGVKPEDYLESFKEYILSHMNEVAALKLIAQKPRDLTVKELKEVQNLLAAEGFSETYLKTAWKDVKQQDVAASIIGFIRAMTIGSPLISYDQRLEKAMQKIFTSRQWTIPQQDWLNRIKKTLKEEKVIDRDCLDRGSFKSLGGFNRINKIFDGELDTILHDINETLWEVAE